MSEPCTCIQTVRVYDGMGRWEVAVADPGCPCHNRSEPTEETK